MIKIREDGHPWTSEECMYMPDFEGRRGIDLLTEAGVEYIPRHPIAPADFGLCKNAAIVHGVPLSKSVLFAWEPPGNIAGLNEPSVRARFMSYLTTCAPFGSPHHFTTCRSFNLVDRFFQQPRDRLVCMISRDRATLPGHGLTDLYSYRRKIVEVFTREFTPEQFHLYGRWPASSHYKGELYASNDLGGFGLECPVNEGGSLQLDGRYEVLPKYHYNICIENSRHPGYMTEKIFHAMAAGCIPIYLGANDIDAAVPRDCYIDMRDRSIEQVIEVMKAQDQASRDRMKERIYNWLKHEGNYWFSSVRFAKKILWAIGKGGPCR